jgi:hypothetical protein
MTHVLQWLAAIFYCINLDEEQITREPGASRSEVAAALHLSSAAGFHNKTPFAAAFDKVDSFFGFNLTPWADCRSARRDDAVVPAHIPVCDP